MNNKIIVILLLITGILISGCLEQSEQRTAREVFGEYNYITPTPDIRYVYVTPEPVPIPDPDYSGIINNANRLAEDYKWKLDLVNEIQKRTDALGTSASRSMYVEWINRNNEAVSSGERLSTYLTENRNILDNEGTPKNWASDYLIYISQNKVTFERDNQQLNQIINNYVYDISPATTTSYQSSTQISSDCISGSNYETDEYLSEVCAYGSNVYFNAYDVTIRGSGSNFIISSDVSKITIYATGSNILYPSSSNPKVINRGTGNNVVKN